MTEQEDYLIALRIIAAEKVTMTEPTILPTIEDQITAKTIEINNLINETTPRPAEYEGYTGKQAYLAYLAHLEAEKAALIAQNDQIIADNAESRVAVIEQYEDDITLCMATVENKWLAVRVVRNDLLRECDWTHVSDSPLEAEDKNLCKDYRKALRDIPDDFEDPDDIVWPTKPACLGTEV
jgi:hypothetical protein